MKCGSGHVQLILLCIGESRDSRRTFRLDVNEIWYARLLSAADILTVQQALVQSMHCHGVLLRSGVSLSLTTTDRTLDPSAMSPVHEVFVCRCGWPILATRIDITRRTHKRNAGDND